MTILDELNQIVDIAYNGRALIQHPKQNEEIDIKIETYAKDIEKSLKALEIIIEHGVDVAEIMICQDYAQYEAIFCANVKGRVKLSKKEYDLLKEVLL